MEVANVTISLDDGSNFKSKSKTRVYETGDTFDSMITWVKAITPEGWEADRVSISWEE